MEEVDLTQVQGQIGSATLDATDDGKIIKATGELLGVDGKIVCTTIFRMLQDTSKCLGNEPMRRLSISFTDHVYVVTLTEKFVYLVKKSIWPSLQMENRIYYMFILHFFNV